MKIHEYQGKELLRQFGVPVPRGYPAFTVQEAVEAAQKLGGSVWVVKAQIHAGGRGKGGGVKLARSLDDAQEAGRRDPRHAAEDAPDRPRRPEGAPPATSRKAPTSRRNTTSSLVTDRATQKVAFIASSEGGMDIEEVAHATPEKIITDFIDPLTGLDRRAGARRSPRPSACPKARTRRPSTCSRSSTSCYMDTDASLVEINPLNCDSKGNLIALDAKFNFDANALFRHPEIVAYRDLDEEDPAEIEASKFDLAYISLDGNIGCLVNGAGLAMATMDTIKLFGGEPANFLDVGGGATAEKVTEAFKIMLKNPNVKGILVNIFGGIMKCDTIAEGVIAACKAVNLQRAAGRAHEGHERRPGQEDAGRLRPAHHRRRHDGRSRHQDRRRRRLSPAKESSTCRSTSTKTPRSSPRASRARPGSSTPAAAATTPTARTLRRRREPEEGRRGLRRHPHLRHRQGSRKARPAPPSRVIYVPPAGAAAAIWEAVEADLDLVVCITEGIPVRDMLMVRNKMKAKEAAGGKKTLLLGPNCPGLITPDEIKIGIMPGHIHRKGRIGVVRRSGTLTYEAVAQLTEIGLGQSSAVGIGGDPINGLKHIDVMKAFNDDPDTDAVIMIGEIGGPDEADAARWCKDNMKKPIVGFIAGVTAPAGKRMGHAGALISGGADTADAKLEIMEECGFTVTRNPSEMGKLLKGLL